jgi:hypothetical protein
MTGSEHPIKPEEAITFQEIREMALNPNFTPGKPHQLVELMLIDDEQEFMKRLKEIIKENTDPTK